MKLARWHCKLGLWFRVPLALAIYSRRRMSLHPRSLNLKRRLILPMLMAELAAILGLRGMGWLLRMQRGVRWLS